MAIKAMASIMFNQKFIEFIERQKKKFNGNALFQASGHYTAANQFCFQKFL